MSETSAGLLYHYTSEPGLQGIAATDHIWLTHIHHLNDWTEFAFNEEWLDALVEAFNNGLPKDVDENAYKVTMQGVLSRRNFPRLLEIIESRPPLGEPKEAFVCSFTADGDAGATPGDRLSQWRGYSHGSQGFSLGFDKALLSQQVKSQINQKDESAELVPCVYDDETKRSIFSEMGKAAAAAFIDLRFDGSPVPGSFVTQWPNPSDDYIRTSYYLLKSLTTVTPRFYRAAGQMKHKGFSEEHEWRIIFHAFHRSLISRLKSRHGQFGLTPYIDFPLGLHDAATSSLRRIVVGPSTYVGPSSHQEDVRHSVELLLTKHGIGGVEVATSMIPYRSA